MGQSILISLNDSRPDLRGEREAGAGRVIKPAGFGTQRRPLVVQRFQPLFRSTAK